MTPRNGTSPAESPQLRRQCLAEGIGTFILVFFGVGAVHVAVLTGALVGLWQVAIVWGVAVALAIATVGAVSGAHINPAITVAFACFRGFPARNVLPFVASQLAGAFAAAAVLHALFHGHIVRFEVLHHLVRGGPGSELSAMMYGDYFPNPAIARLDAGAACSVSCRTAMLGEGLGTALLAFVVFALTDRRRSGCPDRFLVALGIGLTVSVIIAIVAPLTQAGLNPARDFGPRLFAYISGWRSVAIPGPRGGCFAVYILAPMLGSLAGAAVYERILAPADLT